GSAFAAHDSGSSVYPAWRTSASVVPRLTKPTCEVRSRPRFSVAPCGTAREGVWATSVMLGCSDRHACGVAHSGAIHRRNAIGSLACGRACKLPRCRVSFLVAGDPALAECRCVAAMVYYPLPFPRHRALRYPFRISCVLRPCCLHRVSIHAPALWDFRSRRPAARGRTHVDLRDPRVPDSRSDYRGTAAVGGKCG